MQEFIAIDFETANPKRVSACAIGYAKVSNCEIVESNGFLIKPVGGHAPFQTKIHGITDEHTLDKPDFGQLFPEIQGIFKFPLVAHSLFDQQVLNALSNHFGLGLNFEYTDTCSIAKEILPDLRCYKLKTLVKYFGLPAFRHHDATEDALACASIFLKLHGYEIENIYETASVVKDEFKVMLSSILADDKVDYKEAFQLLYWFEDHSDVSAKHQSLYAKTKEFLEDGHLDRFEAREMKTLLINALMSAD